MSRIYSDKIAIQKESTHAFFERRGKGVDQNHPLTSVLYQDDNPELAAARDRWEKLSILPKLAIQTQSSVLDIGCGIGRWAEACLPTCERYHGTDFSASLIDVARKRIDSPNATFQVLAAQDCQPDRIEGAVAFTHVLIAGVLLYLNDDEVAAALSGVGACAGPSCTLYIREPIAVKDRLTLDNHLSQELKAEYSAIYRTEAELVALFESTVLAAGFLLEESGKLYPDDLNNRAETIQKFYVFKRP